MPEVERKLEIKQKEEQKMDSDEDSNYNDDYEVIEEVVPPSPVHETLAKETDNFLETSKMSKSDLQIDSAILEDSEIKDESELGPSPEGKSGGDNKPQFLGKPPEDLKSRVSIVDIPTPIQTEFKLILQNLKIPFDKLDKFFPNTKRITLAQLMDHIRQLDRFDSEEIIEQVCRYLVENDTKGDVIKFDLNADLDKIAIGKPKVIFI